MYQKLAKIIDWTSTGTIITLLSPTDLHRKHTESETEGSNEQIKHATLHINRHKQQRRTGSTFNETGVISQASVGGYCTSVFYKKENDQHDELRTYLHFA